jgi:hypothetical protein
LLNITGIRISPKLIEGQTHNKRTNVMQLHGFRKFFNTTLINTAGMSPIYVDMLMGHDLGLTSSYTKLTPEELLEGNDKNLGYASAMEHLIIYEENRLMIKVEELKEKRNEIQIMKESHKQDMKAMREEMNQQFSEIMSMIQQNPKLAQVKPAVLVGKTIE